LDNADSDTNALDDGDTVTETFSYTTSDGTASSSANIVITIAGANDAPVAVADANGSDPVVEDSDATAVGNVLTNDVDPDDALTVTTVGTFAGAYGSLTIDAAGNYTYTLDNADSDTNALDDGDTVTETFSYTTSDGTASSSANIVITIAGKNDAPVAVADANGSDPVVEDSDATAVGNVLTNDIDPDDALSVTTVGTFVGIYGSVTIDVAGNYTYTLDNADPDTDSLSEGATVTETFSYTASDGTASASANLVITITGKNDAPNAVDDALSTDEDSALTNVAPGVLANDTDVDSGDTRSVTAVNGSAADVGGQVILASGALLTLNANGSLDYDPNGQYESLAAGQTTTDSFTYTITDSHGATDTATATVTITGKNDAPTDITLSSATVAENVDGAVIGKLTAIDPDAGDTHSFIVSDGRFEVIGDQLQLKTGSSLDFETEPSLSIDVTATDKGGLDHTKSFVITVTDVEPENLSGDGGANLLVAGVGDDTLTGLAGNDTLIGGNGADALSGGADDDALIWDPADTTVDGGTGTDTLLVGAGDLDFSATALSAIEKVDLGTANGNNTLTLTAADVINISDTSTLTVTGGAGDSVDAGKGWTGGLPDGFGHVIYTQVVGLSLATLVVDAGVSTNPDILNP
jgi:VCBS repeat-containing protein